MSLWHVLMTKSGRFLSDLKKKTVIDLDDWREPNWNNIGYYVAAGYPEHHKGITRHDGSLLVTTPLVTVIAKSEKGLAPNSPEFTFFGHPEDLKGYTFSGISGGPVYAVEGDEQRWVEDDELFPVGIAFEGHPSTAMTDRGSQEANGAILAQGDFCIRAYTLTPQSFEKWLNETDLV